MKIKGAMRGFLLVLGLTGIFLLPLNGWAQEKIKTPSQKTKEAIGKFHKVPASVQKRLGKLKETAKARLKAAVGVEKPAKNPLDITRLKPGQDERPLYSSVGKRDPFQPLGIVGSNPELPPQCRDLGNLSPLQQLSLGQLKLVGIIWKIDQPKAMVEDAAGLGYVIKLGTPIGICRNQGKVKEIRPSEVVIEEKIRDPIFGTEKTREVKMNLPKD